MASTLPQRTLPSVTLADSRWDSSRSLLDSPPKAPNAEDEAYQENTVAGQVLSALAHKISEANLPLTGSSQGLSTELPMVYTHQDVTAMALRSPRKRLSEKAASMRCLSKGPEASSRKVPSRGLSRSTSVANLDPMASPLSRRMTLADSKWYSSRSLLDSLPMAPATEDEAIHSSFASGMNESSEDSSAEVAPVSLRSQQTIMDGQDVLSALALTTSE
jgi:hypothetical protein